MKVHLQPERAPRGAKALRGREVLELCQERLPSGEATAGRIAFKSICALKVGFTALKVIKREFRYTPYTSMELNVHLEFYRSYILYRVFDASFPCLGSLPVQLHPLGARANRGAARGCALLLGCFALPSATVVASSTPMLSLLKCLSSMCKALFGMENQRPRALKSL